MCGGFVLFFLSPGIAEEYCSDSSANIYCSRH